MKTILLLLFTIITLFKCTDPTTPSHNGPDTTSHNFSWQIDTLGDRSSYLNDVFILDENNIYAVGEIHTQNENAIDSVFSLAHWNGQKWKLIQTLKTDGSKLTKIRGIWVLNENDIWFASGSIYHWNGKTAHMVFQRDIYSDELYTKLWYNNDSDIYAVGDGGYIAHYDGASWTRLVSGTDIHIKDIWGNGNEIYAVASYQYFGTGLAVLKIDGTSVTKLDTSGLRVAQRGIWFDPGNVYYIAGDGVFRKDDTISNEQWINEEDHPLRYKTAIRGTSYKDLFVVGSHGMVSHYNGSTWKHYTDEVPSFYGNWWSVAIKKDIVVAVGNEGGTKALVLRGYRN